MISRINYSFSGIFALLLAMPSCTKNERTGMLKQRQHASVLSSAVTLNTALTRKLYEIISDGPQRGKIYVYDLDNAHHLETVLPGPGAINVQSHVRGVCANAATGYLYFSYYKAGGGNIYCLDMNTNKVVFDKPVAGAKSIDRLTMNPDGKTLYIPTGEHDGTFNFLWQADAMNGNVVGKIPCAYRTHDAQWPLSGPLFQECKSYLNKEGRYMYKINPVTKSVIKIGLYSGILGPYVIDSKSHFMVNCVSQLLGMQIADIWTNTIYTAKFKNQAYKNPTGLLHAIGYTPDEREVWEGTGQNSNDVVIWDNTDPRSPKEKQTIHLKESGGTHWITFSIKGDYGYISPYINSGQNTEIWDTKTHQYIQSIAGSLTMLEADFSNTTHKVVAVGDQYGIGRK